MKEIFHKIYWSQANLTGETAGETNKCFFREIKRLMLLERKKERKIICQN